MADELFVRAWLDLWAAGPAQVGLDGEDVLREQHAAVLRRWIQPSICEHPLRHPFVPNIGVGVLWTAGVLGTGVEVAIFYREGMIVLLRNSSELTAINPRACSAQHSQRMTPA